MSMEKDFSYCVSFATIGQTGYGLNIEYEPTLTREEVVRKAREEFETSIFRGSYGLHDRDRGAVHKLVEAWPITSIELRLSARVAAFSREAEEIHAALKKIWIGK